MLDHLDPEYEGNFPLKGYGFCVSKSNGKCIISCLD